MACPIPIAPPEKFDFKKPDEWPKWKRRFEQFLSASGLDKEDEARQVNTLLYSLGDGAEDVLTSTCIPDADRKKYGKVIEKFDAHFKVRRNIIFERARFNKRDQREGESVEEYITALYSLIETCEYGALKEELLRDRLVVGIRDSKVSEALQMNAELTLEKAKKTIRQKEAVREQTQQLQGSDNNNHKNVDEVRRPRPQRRRGGPTHRNRQTLGDQPRGTRGQASHNCSRCGHATHKTGDRCPARSATCHKCGKKGHYLSQCFSKTTHASARVVEADQESAFLGSVTEQNQVQWTTTLRIARKNVRFKLDTGAEVTAISEATYRTLGRIKLYPPKRSLQGPSGQKLTVLGQFTRKISHTKRVSEEVIFVVRGLSNNLLGLPAIQNLRLIRKIDSTTTTPTSKIHEQFSKVFKGLGTLGEAYKIQLKEDAKPFSLYTPRNVPLPLRNLVKAELERMEQLGVISPVDQPTPWCAGMVVVPKRSGMVRICVDLKPLNESVLREVYPLPKVDEVLGKLAGAKVFTKLDANSGFWQIPLAEESRHLTTFITPFGRYCFNKLPFGISSAPELFQKRMGKLVEGLEGAVCLIDDVLVFGDDQEQHDARLEKVLKRVESAGVTLNPDKCEFSKSSIKFLGHCIDQQGIRVDPEKTAALCRMEPPKTVSDLRRFMGMVNQMGKFSPNIAQMSKPLRDLLSIKRAWLWGPEQDRAFNALKAELTKPTVLALYDSTAKSKVSADASSFGLGAVLLQKNKECEWKPVAYASRSLTETERNYAQIEKEALAVTWSCEKFSDYVLGCRFEIETDHKPLVPLLSRKHLSDLPPRVLRFRLRMEKFDYEIHHVPGKYLYTADALSRDPFPESEPEALQGEVESFVESVTKFCLPATKERLQVYRDAQQDDAECAQILEYCKTGWPKKEFVPDQIIPFWNFQDRLTICEDLLMFNSRIVVPQSLRSETLLKIHTGHLGIEKCKKRTLTSVWWPGVAKQVEEMINKCPVCVKESRPAKEPLMTSTLPKYPWQVVGTDLFELNKSNYLLAVDYFSRYPEIVKLSSTTSSGIITGLKSIFARHGVPEVLKSDNGPQYSSAEFKSFTSSYGIQHVTSSPKFPQSNGEAERCVQTVKNLLKKSDDPYAALLSYRATSLTWCEHSPAELSMGRRLRTSVPQAERMLVPQWTYLPRVRELHESYKRKQKENYDTRYRTRDLPMIPDNTAVWITTEEEPVRGTIVSPADRPRSYVVDTPTGRLQRNRSQLRVLPTEVANGNSETPSNTTTNVPPKRIMTRTQTGTTILPPDRL